MSKRIYWIACMSFAGLLAGEPLEVSAQEVAGSCWGNCGDYEPISGCSCDTNCQVRGDCCKDKDALCFARGAQPVCPLVNGNTDQAVYGTDLGFSYEHKGNIEFLFGDTFSSDTPGFCGGLQTDNDDSLALLQDTTRPSWFPTTTGAQVACPPLQFEKRDANSFEPVTVSVNGVSLKMPGLVTPAAGWSDGTTAFTWVASGQPLGCTIWNPCPNGAVCHDPWNGSCFPPNCTQLCFDPTTPFAEYPFLFSHEIAYRPNEAEPTAYVSGHTFYTNKLSVPTAVTVAAFDPDNPANSDYSQGHGTLLLFGRPTFYDPNGRAVPYLAYQDLDSLEPVNGEIDWAPQYYAGPDASGDPTWSANMADAEPLVASDFNLASWSEMTFVEPLGKWIMLYAGDVLALKPTPAPPVPVWDHLADETQARKGAIHVRMADHPWGPWTRPVPILFRESMVGYMGCNRTSPPYGTGAWKLGADVTALALWEAGCQRQARPCGPSSTPVDIAPGTMYAPNIIDNWTFDATGATYPKAAQIYFNVSTFNPYQVVVATARIELPPDNRATFKRKVHLRAYDEELVADSSGSATTSDQPDNTKTHLELRSFTNPSASGDVRNGSRVVLRSKDGRYLRRTGAHDVGFYSSISASSELIVERVLGNGTVQINTDSDILRLRAVGTERRLKQRDEGLRFYDGTGSTSNFRLTWGCKDDDDCSPAR